MVPARLCYVPLYYWLTHWFFFTLRSRCIPTTTVHYPVHGWFYCGSPSYYRAFCSAVYASSIVLVGLWLPQRSFPFTRLHHTHTLPFFYCGSSSVIADSFGCYFTFLFLPVGSFGWLSSSFVRSGCTFGSQLPRVVVIGSPTTVVPVTSYVDSLYVYASCYHGLPRSLVPTRLVCTHVGWFLLPPRLPCGSFIPYHHRYWLYFFSHPVRQFFYVLHIPVRLVDSVHSLLVIPVRPRFIFYVYSSNALPTRSLFTLFPTTHASLPPLLQLPTFLRLLPGLLPVQHCLCYFDSIHYYIYYVLPTTIYTFVVVVPLPSRSFAGLLVWFGCHTRLQLFLYLLPPHWVLTLIPFHYLQFVAFSFAFFAAFTCRRAVLIYFIPRLLYYGSHHRLRVRVLLPAVRFSSLPFPLPHYAFTRRPLRYAAPLRLRLFGWFLVDFACHLYLTLRSSRFVPGSFYVRLFWLFTCVCDATFAAATPCAFARLVPAFAYLRFASLRLYLHLRSFLTVHGWLLRSAHVRYCPYPLRFDYACLITFAFGVPARCSWLLFRFRYAALVITGSVYYTRFIVVPLRVDSSLV